MSDPRRFRPVRAGIVNLYEYGEQVFTFSGGRLLLRGHNTSGKTKALELLLPFCLDGDIAPHKLDPFARAAKQMKWNLVGCVDDDQRVGYVWVEFERIADNGGVERITAGVGMKANRSLPEVRRWHFIARGRRIGDDLSLLRGREPLSRADLVAELGDDGQVLDHQADYREQLNALVFGFASMDQYQTMLRLMLELRRPHLSKTLDPDGVAAMLSAGLPIVDEALMRRVAGGLEQLESLEQGLARLRSVRERARRFHEQTYRTYLRAVVRDRTAELRSAASAYEHAAAETRRLADEREAAERELESLREQLAATRTTVDRLDGEERALLSSPEWSSVAEVEQLRERAAAQARAADALERAAQDAHGRVASAEAEAVTARAAADASTERARTTIEELGSEAARAGMGGRHAALASQLTESGIAPPTWADLARDTARGWRAVLERHGELLRETAATARRLSRARETETLARDRLREAEDHRRTADDELAVARATLDAAVDEWRAALVELVHPDQQAHGSTAGDDAGSAFEQTLDAARAHALAGGCGADRLAGPAAERAGLLTEERAALLARRDGLEAEIAELASQRRSLEAEQDEPPPAGPLRRTPRDGRAGAPLWRLVDFRADVDRKARPALEAGLQAMGILDAWVMPDGLALDAREQDLFLVAGETAPSARTLADVLAPVANAGVDVALIEALLRRIGLDSPPEATGTAAAAAVGPDGEFRLGPLAGAAAKDHVDYIGATARAERRARRIEALIDRETEIAGQCEELTARANTLERRLAHLRDELARFPIADAVGAALRAVGVAHAVEARVSAEHEQAVTATRVAADEQVARAADQREHAVEHRLAPDLDDDGLARRREACAAYIASVPGTAHQCIAAADAGRQVAAVQERVSGLRRAAGEQQRAAGPERHEATRLAAEHATRELALGDTGVEIRARHAEVAGQLHSARADRDRLDFSRARRRPCRP